MMRHEKRSTTSLLSWERGLKLMDDETREKIHHVAPLVGAWIEIGDMYNITDQFTTVAPLVGAWIEITAYYDALSGHYVAPLVGAWIEM